MLSCQWLLFWHFIFWFDCRASSALLWWNNCNVLCISWFLHDVPHPSSCSRSLLTVLQLISQWNWFCSALLHVQSHLGDYLPWGLETQLFRSGVPMGHHQNRTLWAGQSWVLWGYWGQQDYRKTGTSLSKVETPCKVLLCFSSHHHLYVVYCVSCDAPLFLDGRHYEEDSQWIQDFHNRAITLHTNCCICSHHSRSECVLSESGHLSQ